MSPLVPAGRRTFLAAGATAGAVAAAPRALAQWQPSPRYPDPSVRVLYSLFVNTQGVAGG